MVYNEEQYNLNHGGVRGLVILRQEHRSPKGLKEAS